MLLYIYIYINDINYLLIFFINLILLTYKNDYFFFI